MKNSVGRVATRHKNDKYYCGDKMKFKHKSEHYPTEWIPDNKLNWPACMKLDMEARGVEMLGKLLIINLV